MWNRFLKKDDENINTLGSFKLPREWWSRGYEYAFMKNFVKPNDKILDAGCGIEHPFKWWAADEAGAQVIAVDMDQRLHEFPSQDNIKWYCTMFEQLPLLKPAIKVDKLFCISVLEHVKNPAQVIKAFGKCLNKGKKAYFTIDYPLLHPDIFLNIISDDFDIGKCDYTESENDIIGPQGLRVYTAVLTRR